MALQLKTKVTVTRDCGTFLFKDITEAYNSVTNPTGYGSPNTQAANINSSTVNLVVTNMSTGSSSTFYLGYYLTPATIPSVVNYSIPTTGGSATLSGATGNGSAITYTSTTNHGFTVGQTVTISGFTNSAFNITGYIASVPTTTSFTIASVTNASVSGTATATASYLSMGDAVYKFTYTINDSADSNKVYQAVCYVVNDCTICCELESKLKDLSYCGSCCKENQRDVNMLYEAYMLRSKAHHLAACNDFAGAQEVLDYLNRLLDVTYCDTCYN